VDTRLARLEEGRADALLLACAGLDRLGRAGVISRRLDPDELLPAPAQGALAMTCRKDDGDTRAALATQDDFAARCEAEAERALLNHLRGGCRAPVGARGLFEERGKTLTLSARVLSLDGRLSLEETRTGPCTDVVQAGSLGRLLADRLLSLGAAALIDAARAASP
jgi:hydroxymethylbilane synthase